MQGCDAQTPSGRAAHPQTTDADPAVDGQRCPYKPGDDCETPRSQMTADQAKAYCIAQPWCVGFEYGSENIYFKYEMCPLGRWEGAGNGGSEGAVVLLCFHLSFRLRPRLSVRSVCLSLQACTCSAAPRPRASPTTR
eukprot:SAG22_NODE_3166_length_1885_cov_16.865423_3_plen_137_part_00